MSLVYFDVSRARDDDYIYHGKTDFTGLHTRRPVRLKDSLVGDRVRVNETNVFPEYYLIAVKRFPDVVRDNLDEWVWAFKHSEVPEEFASPGIDALKDKFDYLRMTEIDRRRFHAHLDATRSALGTITHAREEGREEGLAQDMQIGREEGLAQGMQMGREGGVKQGKAEGAHGKAWEIARALEQEGIPSARIAGITGIPLTYRKNKIS